MPARYEGGSVVLLADQDRRLWDRAKIEEGHAIVQACIRRDWPGPYQLQAAIQAVHCNADSFAETDWPQIVALYDHLYVLRPTPVVALNRAIAVGEIDGSDVALEALDDLAPDLDGYHLLHSARAETLRRLRRFAEAEAAYERAAQLASSEADRRFLEHQIQSLQQECTH